MVQLLLLGLLLGMRHALDADHLAAVASLAAGGRSLPGALRLGAAWGLGHTLTLLSFGILLIAAGDAVPGSLSAWLEVAVGVMLVFLGVDVLRRVMTVSRRGTAEGEADRVEGIDLRRAVTVGLLHGLAGSSALVLLALDQVESVAAAMLYVICFGAGATIGMALLSIVIAMPLRRLALAGVEGLWCATRSALGVATIGIGLAMIAQLSGGLMP